jgi:heme exporter protein A
VKLVVTDVAIERGGRALFPPLSFTADEAMLVRIGGANGAGKTTLLRAFAGLTSVAQGSIQWLQTISPNAIGRSSVFMGHSNAMNDAMTVSEHWAYVSGVAGSKPSKGEMLAALDKFGVAALANRRVGTLSQGQKKRSALAGLFLPVNAGAAWLLDEPFVALDAATQSLLATHIGDALTRGTTVVLTSHQSVAIVAEKTLEVAL